MNLWEPTTCCCCCNVRTGSIVLAIFFLVGSCFNILGGIKTLMVGHVSIQAACEDASDIEQCTEELWKLEVGMTITSMVISCFQIILNSLLLHGILKKKTKYFIPLMTVYVIQISLLILCGVIVIIVFIVIGLPFLAVILFAVPFGLFIFLQTYFLLVIRAHYYEIKREKGHVHTALNDRNVEDSPVSPYPGPQLSPYPGPQLSPYPGPQPSPYPGSQFSSYPGHQPPPYPNNEVPPYPGSDVPLYPDMEKAPK